MNKSAVQTTKIIRTNMKAGIQRLAFIIMLAVIAFANVYGQATTIQMHRENSGTYTVPCTVNGLPLRFIFDTGASTVCISSMEAIFMLKNGYLKQSDIKGRSYSQVASGAIVEGMTVNLKTVEIGGLKLYNVEAAVVNSLSAPLLFGQSAIQKLGPIKLDGDKLIIGKVNVLNEEQRKNKAHEISYRAALATQSGRYEDALELYNQANSLYPTADAYDGLCEVYAKLGNKEEAIKASEHAVSLEPANYNYVYNYAVSLYQNDNLDAAERFFKEAYNIIDNNKRPAGTYKGQIVYAYSEREVFILQTCCIYLGELYQTKKMTDKAVLWYKRAGNALDERNNAIANLRLGDIAFDSVQYRKAIEYYKIGVAEEPERPSNLPRYYKMGIAYEKIDVPDSSYIYFGKATAIYKKEIKSYLDKADPTDFRLYSYAMESYLKQADWLFDYAKESHFNKSEVYACAFVDSCYNIVAQEGYGYKNGRKGALSTKKVMTQWAVSSFLVGDTTTYNFIFPRAIKLYPEEPNLLYLSSFTYTDDSKNAKLLIPIYEKIISNGGLLFTDFYLDTKAAIFNKLAWCLCFTGDYKKAKENASTATLLEKDNPIFWETYGETCFYDGDMKECINALTKSIELSEGKINTYWLKNAYETRGEAYIKLGKQSKGEKDLETSRQLQ